MVKRSEAESKIVINRTLDDQFGSVGSDAGCITRGAVIKSSVLRFYRFYREHAAPAVDVTDARAGDRVC